MLIHSSTIQLLRFHFSFFLMPVYWFALSQNVTFDTGKALLVFGILHLLVYPASNGYNSYMDRDNSPVGGIRDPKQPTRQLFYATIIMDIVSVLLSILISSFFALGILVYILASRAYSYRGIRLKKYPVLGYITVVVCQGALVYLLVSYGCQTDPESYRDIDLTGMLAASLLIGGFYPLTQIYQHREDKADGVTSISSWLGYKGTFIFTGLIYLLAMTVLGYHMIMRGKLELFLFLQVFFIPVLVYFVYWFKKVWADPAEANYSNTMRMNLLASFCSNAAFITLLIMEQH